MLIYPRMFQRERLEMTINEMYELATEEHLEFDRIADSDKRHPRPDLCGMLYLHEKLGGKGDMVCGASHDEFCLAPENIEMLTQEDVVYLIRCGVLYNNDTECLYMFT